MKPISEYGQFAVPAATPVADLDARPWLRWYDGVPSGLVYPELSLYQALSLSAQKTPKAIAWDFFDTTSTYEQFLHDIDDCAEALAALGLKCGDSILIAMPNSPQGIIAFYAANKLGAVPALIHPLSTAPEIEQCLNASKARFVLTLDLCYAKVTGAKPTLPIDTIVLTRLSDYLPLWKSLLLRLKGVRLSTSVPSDSRVKWWRALSVRYCGSSVPVHLPTRDEPAVIMFSAGTTGVPKGVVLSNRNFIAEGLAATAWLDIREMHSVLAAMPIFHGFGLGLCINAAFMAGGQCILVPVPQAKIVAELVKKKHPNILLAVPTFYAALSHNRALRDVDLSCVSAAFSGGDSLSPALKQEFDTFIASRGSSAELLQGYGLTETVSAVMAMPAGKHQAGSIGIPLPDVRAKICKIGADTEVAVGTEGEICIAGPPVMVGYLNDPEATAQALHRVEDGTLWLHTGDLGTMDSDGFFYLKERLKRVIKSSGFNVFPSQVEAVLNAHPVVRQACVVGIPDDAQGQKVKAFVVLDDSALSTLEMECELRDYCRSRLIKWSCPREIVFCKELPQTRLGKIDYKALSRA